MLGEGIVSFGVPARARLQEIEVVAEDAAVEREAAFDLEARGREIHIALVAVKVHGDVLLNLAHAADLVEEVHVPGRAAEFAVGDALQAQLFLQFHDIANGDVFGLAQIAWSSGARPCVRRVRV